MTVRTEDEDEKELAGFRGGRDWETSGNARFFPFFEGGESTVEGASAAVSGGWVFLGRLLGGFSNRQAWRLDLHATQGSLANLKHLRLAARLTERGKGV